MVALEAVAAGEGVGDRIRVVVEGRRPPVRRLGQALRKEGGGEDGRKASYN